MRVEVTRKREKERKLELARLIGISDTGGKILECYDK
jgi:hypothetical protein